MISKTYFRYIWLLNLLLGDEAFTYEEIVDLWRKDPNGSDNYPLRTFHEHRKGIKEMFGVDIICEKSMGYAYTVRNREDLINLRSGCSTNIISPRISSWVIR